MGQRLLVVDNDRAFLDEHKAMLEAAFEVEYLATTDGAMPRLERGGVATVLVCVEVSENKGYALCSAIRRSPALQELKIVLISAKATEEEYARHQSLKGRADLYLHKPMEPTALVASLSPFVPARSGEPDNLLDDLDGSDLGEEWLESLKTELEVDFSTLPEPSAPPLEPALALESATTRVLPDATLEARVQELEAQLRERDALLAQSHQELPMLFETNGDSERIQSLEGAHAAAEEELARVRESLALSQERVQALECQAQVQPVGGSEEYERELRLLRQDVAGLEATLRGQRRELGEKDMRVQDMEQEVSELRPRAEAAFARAAELEATQGTLSEELEAVRKELGSTQQRLQNAERVGAEAEIRVDELEVKAAELKGSLEQAEAEREVFRTDLEACQTRLAETEGHLAEKSALALAREEELSTLGEQFEAACATQERQVEELSELRGSLERLETSFLTCQQELEGMQSERDQAQARVAELEGRLSREAQASETQRMELMAGIDEREAALALGRSKVDELEAALAQGRTQAEELETSLALGKTRIEELEKAKLEVEGHLNARSARLDSLTEVISDLESGIRRATDLTRPF